MIIYQKHVDYKALLHFAARAVYFSNFSKSYFQINLILFDIKRGRKGFDPKLL